MSEEEDLQVHTPSRWEREGTQAECAERGRIRLSLLKMQQYAPRQTVTSRVTLLPDARCGSSSRVDSLTSRASLLSWSILSWPCFRAMEMATSQFWTGRICWRV